MCFSSSSYAQVAYPFAQYHFIIPADVISPDGGINARVTSSYEEENKSTQFKITFYRSGPNDHQISPISHIDFPKYTPSACAGLRKNLNDIAFSSDNKYIVTVTGWISIYDYDQQLVCDDHAEYKPGAIEVWNIQTGKLKTTLSYPGEEKYTADYHTVVCSPDGKYIAAMGDYAVRIWDAKTFKYIRKLPWSSYGRKLVFSPDSKLLLGGRRGVNWLIWDVATGKLLRKLDDTSGIGKNETASDMRFSDDGKVIVGIIYEYWENMNGPLGIWSTKTGKLLHKIHQQPSH